MNFSFRMNARTLCGMAAALLALLLLLDIQSLRQTARQPLSQAGMSGAVQERVVTREFNLVDDSGQTRVRLGMNELNAPALSLSDQNGQERALLRLNQNDVPSLRLFDGNGTLRQGLGFTRGTLTPGLWFFDENGSTQQLIPGSDTNAVNRSSASADYNSNAFSVTTCDDAVHVVVAPAETTNANRAIIHLDNNIIRWNAKTVPGSVITVQSNDGTTVVHVK